MATTLTRFLSGPFGSQIPCFETRYASVYILHFSSAHYHARHYCGVAHDLEERLARHRAGNGAKLMEVVKKAGIDFEVCRLWRFDTFEEAHDFERKLKKWQMSPRLCPLCTGKPLDVLTAMRHGYWPFHLFGQGKRRPMGGRSHV
jgi:predicted GIY-YIG superfamily endonuclease